MSGKVIEKFSLPPKKRFFWKTQHWCNQDVHTVQAVANIEWPMGSRMRPSTFPEEWLQRTGFKVLHRLKKKGVETEKRGTRRGNHEKKKVSAVTEVCRWWIRHKVGYDVRMDRSRMKRNIVQRGCMDGWIDRQMDWGWMCFFFAYLASTYVVVKFQAWKVELRFPEGRFFLYALLFVTAYVCIWRSALAFFFVVLFEFVLSLKSGGGTIEAKQDGTHSTPRWRQETRARDKEILQHLKDLFSLITARDWLCCGPEKAHRDLCQKNNLKKSQHARAHR